MTDKTPIDVLKSVFGYSSFRDNQQDVIEQIIVGHDVVLLMPTGGGKSLCYQIPSILREGTGVVISPLIALMQDQVNALKQLGVKAAFINSSQSLEEIKSTQDKLMRGQLDILYIAPERLLSPYMMNRLLNIPIALFAIDEAHCVSQWGHDFRKEYQQLNCLAENFPDIPRIAVTATADEKTREEIVLNLNLEKARLYVLGFDRSNITYNIEDEGGSFAKLWAFLEKGHLDESGIVYCLSRKKTEQIAEQLKKMSCRAFPYHADLSSETRREHQRIFQNEEKVIIVATVAFGMGIDKPDVRFVAHLNLPKSIEAYYQETGRSGRDGEPATAWMSYSAQDVITLKKWIEESDADDIRKNLEYQNLNALLDLCETQTCRRKVLLEYFGEHPDSYCGSCDNCISPPETWDASIPAQMALSCAYRSGQRFGMNYLIDVLLGKEQERILMFRHNQLSTFGIGKDFSKKEWTQVFRKLISSNYFLVDTMNYNSLLLTEKSRNLLRGKEKFLLRTKKDKEKSTYVQSASKNLQEFSQEEKTIYEAFCNLRKELAEKENVPAYVIFHNTTIHELVKKRPVNELALKNISGLGENKTGKYGKLILDILEKYQATEKLFLILSETQVTTLELFRQGMSLHEIAEKRELKSSTILNHLSKAIEANLIKFEEVIPLSARDYQKILRAFQTNGQEGKLKPVFEALDERFDYETLKCFSAHINAGHTSNTARQGPSDNAGHL